VVGLKAGVSAAKKSMNLRAMVFGPAYLDRVLRVDRPLVAPALGPPIDQSVDGSLGFAGGRNLELTDPSGYTIELCDRSGGNALLCAWARGRPDQPGDR
jgi:hypothetical protein